MPLVLGQSGGQVVKGFNAPNLVIIGRNVRPGQQIQLAVFGINGPISQSPENFIWIRSATLDFYKEGRATASRETAGKGFGSIRLLTPSSRPTPRSRSWPMAFCSPKARFGSATAAICSSAIPTPIPSIAGRRTAAFRSSEPRAVTRERQRRARRSDRGNRRQPARRNHRRAIDAVLEGIFRRATDNLHCGASTTRNSFTVTTLSLPIVLACGSPLPAHGASMHRPRAGSTTSSLAEALPSGFDRLRLTGGSAAAVAPPFTHNPCNANIVCRCSSAGIPQRRGQGHLLDRNRPSILKQQAGDRWAMLQ